MSDDSFDSFDSYESEDDTHGDLLPPQEPDVERDPDPPDQGGGDRSRGGTASAAATAVATSSVEVSSAYATIMTSSVEHNDFEGSPSLSVWKSQKSPKLRKKFHLKKPHIDIKKKIKSMRKKGGDTTVFAVSLETAVHRSKLGDDCIGLPTVFRQCIDFLGEVGVFQEGIYRLPGVKSKIEAVKIQYDKGEDISLADNDPNTVASLFKLYFRSLPEQLIPPRILIRLESACSMSPAEKQLAELQELMDEIPPVNKLTLGWLFAHMNQIAEQSALNKMNVSNLVIVFSPTLQIPVPILHTLYHNREKIFGKIELKKYVRTAGLTKDAIVGIDNLETEEEITDKLQTLTATLERLHNSATGKYSDNDNLCWDLQRAITELRRKKKAIQKTQTQAQGIQDVEFMKTLMLMEATLKAENEELLVRKDELQAAIRREVELIDRYKKELQNLKTTVNGEPREKDESGDETELAKKVATWKWYNKELELRNENLIKTVSEEEAAIMELRVKLKVIPLERALNSTVA